MLIQYIERIQAYKEEFLATLDETQVKQHNKIYSITEIIFSQLGNNWALIDTLPPSKNTLFLNIVIHKVSPVPPSPSENIYSCTTTSTLHYSQLHYFLAPSSTYSSTSTTINTTVKEILPTDLPSNSTFYHSSLNPIILPTNNNIYFPTIQL